MKLPPNSTLEEQERLAYITGDVKTAALYREIEQLQEQVTCFTTYSFWDDDDA
jgi:hypothetical protein